MEIMPLEWLSANIELIMLCVSGVVVLKLYLLHMEKIERETQEARTERARVHAASREAVARAESAALGVGFGGSPPSGEDGDLIGSILSNPETIKALMAMFSKGGTSAQSATFQEPRNPPSSGEGVALDSA